jgi:hypothetical protein
MSALVRRRIRVIWLCAKRLVKMLRTCCLLISSRRCPRESSSGGLSAEVEFLGPNIHNCKNAKAAEQSFDGLVLG